MNPAAAMPGDWRPSASSATLQARAEMLARLRAFFAARGVLEVETPMLSAAATPAPYLNSLVCLDADAGRRLGWLHTSPEFPMKRLLAAGSGPIYQVCKVFRGSECGRWHNPEFSLLEWYRPGWSLDGLLDELEALLRALWQGPRPFPGAVQRRSYAGLFAECLGVDGLEADAQTLHAVLRAAGETPPALSTLDLDAWRDLAFSLLIQPRLQGVWVVTGYPASQAALARLDPADPRLADRAELFIDGVELANGYAELTDADEQRRRFEAELTVRRRDGLAEVTLDQRFLAALASGMPVAAGMALGLDRLLMVNLGLAHIDQVLAFAHGRA